MKCFLLISMSLLLALTTVKRALADDPEVDRIIKVLTDPDKSEKTKGEELKKFSLLKEKAAPAVPLLVKSFEDRTSSDAKKNMVIDTLGAIGKPGVPALANILPDKKFSRRAAAALGKVGAEAKEAVPALLAQGVADSYNAGTYFGAVTKIGGDPKDTVPAAIKHLMGGGSSESACELLLVAGPAAKDAVPVLIEAVKPKRPGGFRIKGPAIEALGAIGPDAESALPYLREILKDSKYGKRAEKAIEQIQAKK